MFPALILICYLVLIKSFILGCLVQTSAPWSQKAARSRREVNSALLHRVSLAHTWMSLVAMGPAANFYSPKPGVSREESCVFVL